MSNDSLGVFSQFQKIDVFKSHLTYHLTIYKIWTTLIWKQSNISRIFRTIYLIHELR